jgi:hypothetical protein
MGTAVHSSPDAGMRDVETVWAQAYKRSTVATAQEAARELLEWVGPRVTAAAVGLREARTVRSWAAGRAPLDQAEAARLRLLHRIALAITGVYGRPEVTTAFLTSASPALEDCAPLEVLADTPPAQAEKRLLAALRAFLAD